MHTLLVDRRRNSLMQFLLRKWRLPLVFVLAAGLSACGSGVSTTGASAQVANGSGTSAGSSPTVALSPSPLTLASGQSATLSWSSTNATSCSASGAWSGTVSTSGTESTGPLKATAQYMLTCTGAGGSKTQSATVTVNAAPPTGSAAPTVAISADPSIVPSGGSTTLTWTSTGATACTASGAWSGTEPVSGTQSTGALSADATYTLTCTGAGGNATQSATVSVRSTPPPTGSSCSGTSGPLTLKVNAVRGSGISPFLMFFDATGTTDSSLSGRTTAFQDVSYSWNFGDTGASGTETWAHGANAGHNSKNTATGGGAAHLYVTPGPDIADDGNMTPRVGAKKAHCPLRVRATDPDAGARHVSAQH